MTAGSFDGKESRGPGERSKAIGLRLIIGYKLVKATIELLLGASFLLLGSVGLSEELTAVAHVIRYHATEAWSVALAERLILASTAQNVFVVAVAVIADGAVTLVEGWALHRGYRWSRWLVVCATSLFLPFEIVTLARHPSTGRVMLLLVNALIVIYLLWRRVAVTTNSHGVTAP